LAAASGTSRPARLALAAESQARPPLADRCENQDSAQRLGLAERCEHDSSASVQTLGRKAQDAPASAVRRRTTSWPARQTPKARAPWPTAASTPPRSASNALATKTEARPVRSTAARTLLVSAPGLGLEAPRRLPPGRPLQEPHSVTARGFGSEDQGAP
jgi:hypothetical protein